MTKEPQESLQTPILVSARQGAGLWGEVVVAGELEDPRVKTDVIADAFEDDALQVVVRPARPLPDQRGADARHRRCVVVDGERRSARHGVTSSRARTSVEPRAPRHRRPPNRTARGHRRPCHTLDPDRWPSRRRCCASRSAMPPGRCRRLVGEAATSLTAGFDTRDLGAANDLLDRPAHEGVSAGTRAVLLDIAARPCLECPHLIRRGAHAH
jgi:hypothetical protein